MSSTFSGLSTALNALMSQRAALTVTGQNIANANTVGYSRQRAELSAIMGKPVHLYLHVKVKPGWDDERDIYREMGLDWVE